jgi:hypothetical protein
LEQEELDHAHESMLAMQKDWDKLKLDRDSIMRKVEGKKEWIAGFERALGRARQSVPQLIEDLKKSAPQLREFQ